MSAAATNLQQRVCCCAPMLVQIGRRTDTVPLRVDRAAHIMRSMPVLRWNCGRQVRREVAAGSRMPRQRPVRERVLRDSLVQQHRHGTRWKLRQRMNNSVCSASAYRSLSAFKTQKINDVPQTETTHLIVVALHADLTRLNRCDYRPLSEFKT